MTSRNSKVFPPGISTWLTSVGHEADLTRDVTPLPRFRFALPA